MNLIRNIFCQNIKNVALFLILGLFLFGCGNPESEDLPNILWITSENNWYENITDVAQFIGIVREWEETRNN